MSIQAGCSECWTRLDIPDRLIGKMVKCRACGQVFRAAANAAGHETVAPQANDARLPVRSCPACGVKGAADATTCQYCGAVLQTASGRRPIVRS